MDAQRQGLVWCDASSIGIGVVVEIGSRVVEDAAWLRKADDFSHINLAEMEAVLKGINLAVKWGLTEIKVMTDSSTVFGWVKATLTEEKRVRTKGAEEILIKRRLGALKNMISELKLAVEVVLVPSCNNKADQLSRVKKEWLMEKRGLDNSFDVSGVVAASVNLKESHNEHHMGVERSLYVARELDPNVTREEVVRVARECDRCQSVNPAPVSHSSGELSVQSVWSRIAIDVTHYRGSLYLSIIDCGPGRFAVWRRIKFETAECIKQELEQLMLERGPVSEVLMDNAAAFRSNCLQLFFQQWNIQPFFRAAYKPSGNGIVERHHRTIKAMSEKANICPELAVFWYNFSPRCLQKKDSLPYSSVYSYSWRHPGKAPNFAREQSNEVSVGEEVWVKPPNAKRTTHWDKGIVTSLNSDKNISVDGTPRHILDIRRVVKEGSSGENNEGGEDINS